MLVSTSPNERKNQIRKPGLDPQTKHSQFCFNNFSLSLQRNHQQHLLRSHLVAFYPVALLFLCSKPHAGCMVLV